MERESFENAAIAGLLNREYVCIKAVSYTHLDVYKRQAYTISDVLSAAAAAAVCIWQYHMLKKKIFAPETGKRKEDGYGIKSGTADYAGNCYKE